MKVRNIICLLVFVLGLFLVPSAIFASDTYTVSFNSNGGSYVSSQNLPLNSTVTEPSPPTKFTYIFDGWYKDSNLTILFDFETEKLTSNITLYAKWTANYNESDLVQLRTFLNQPSAIAGKTNGQILNPMYKPDDPSTWWSISWIFVDGTRYLHELNWQNKSLSGDLSLYNCASLETINCSSNNLTAITVSSNPKLKTVYCNSNQLTLLKIENNDSLTNLLCQHNKLITLACSNNFALLNIVCNDNKLKSLSFNGCVSLTTLNCSNNLLTSLNTDNNINLTDLNCIGNNELTSIDVSKNTALTTLSFGGDKFTSIDLSKNITLKSISCTSGQLSNLDVSNNVALEFLSCSHCALTSLDLSNNNCLKYLNCSNNKLTLLDLSKNINLTEVYCSYNSLTSLNSSNDIKLETLYCDNNKLNTINLSGCSSLREIYCNHNWYLHTLDLSSCPLLYQLECYCDQLISINVSKCPNLTILRCDSNILTSLDIRNNVNLRYLNCNANYNLTNLDVSKNVYLKTLYCSGNLINSLDISHNRFLNILYFKNTRINSFTANFFGTVSTVTSHNGYLSIETDTFPNCSIVAEPVINNLAFKCWALNGIPCSNNISYSVRSAIIGELRANFVDSCNITVISNNTSYGTVSGGGQYDFDQTATITATPAAGCYFVGWYENSVKYYSYYKSTFPMTHDRIITAVFAPIPTPTIYSIAASGYDSITLKWYPCDGATYYQVYRATSPNGTYYMESSGPLCSLEDTFLKAGQYYYYKVKAVCSDGYTTYSSFSSYKYAQPGPVVSDVSVVSASSYNYNSIKVSWGAVSGASGYELYKTSSETGNYTLLKSTTSTYFVNTSLTTGSTYYYKV
ncbi:MAG: InlB B-repeat-containing protein, partial [Eubacteriaceae bacterium]